MIKRITAFSCLNIFYRFKVKNTIFAGQFRNMPMPVGLTEEQVSHMYTCIDIETTIMVISGVYGATHDILNLWKLNIERFQT